MKQCASCGRDMPDDAIQCICCGYKEKPPKTYLGIRIFMIIGCIASIRYYCIPLLWAIPMTITVFNRIKEKRKETEKVKGLRIEIENLEENEEEEILEEKKEEESEVQVEVQKKTKKINIWFKIATILFVNEMAGFLLLGEKDL